jgi:LysR family hydrogen peroxide-inducible transcriptional activator
MAIRRAGVQDIVSMAVIGNDYDDVVLPSGRCGRGRAHALRPYNVQEYRLPMYKRAACAFPGLGLGLRTQLMRHSPHPVSLRQLQYVVAVADTRSFRRAAELCAVSQPSLSAQVAQLEEVIGMRLFERDRRRVLLTPAGELLVAQARRVLAEADEWMDTATRIGDPLAGKLRIGVIPTISPYLLPEIVPALRQHFPRLQIVWVEDKTGSLKEEIAAGRLDAGLVALEADLGEVEHTVIGRDCFVLATPRRHELGAPTKPIQLAQLDETEVLLLDDGHCFRDQVLALCSGTGAREKEFRATSLATLTQMVAAGGGVTLLPLIALPTENRRGELAVRRFADPAPGRTIALVWRRRSPLEKALKRLAESMRESFEKFMGGLGKHISGGRRGVGRRSASSAGC